MNDIKPATIVLGAGVVGTSTALYLQRSGHHVTIVDPLPPAGGTSFGNAGLISADTAVPIALPGMLRKVPGWLTNPLGPLAVKPAYLPRALPWLLRWIEASRMSRVIEISDAMRVLHRDSFTCWRELLGDENYYDLIRSSGQVRIWEGEGAGSAIEATLCERHGIRAEPLGADDLRQIFPGIARDLSRGLLMPGNGYTVSPQRLVRTLGKLFVEGGGEIIAERALKIVPRNGAGYMVMTNLANRSAQRIVVATGAWSRELLDPLGIYVPLESERGYHAMMPSPNMDLRMPLSVKSRGFGLTPMEDGIRAAGTIEIGGLQEPPNEKRALALIEHARRIFPDLKSGEPRLWMGHRPSTPDSLPILGEATGWPDLYLALGHGHFGMTGGPPSARLVARLINREAPGVDVTRYSADRFKRSGAAKPKSNARAA
ncbi:MULTISPECIES: NAD(P)/FAD-dependent oxidoreductase [unclassified Aurantimonas]|uniref:NAD(P)/FAD-dependent oxidoreductase n=1 Tax=unclassified Aurantimonas TaxID=2638230 RepID=UPI002E192127|nr:MULTISPECIES: FAD-dependent oxidoreductase [unclassified Aurantimonas]MEC5293405.1 FAD-dependent oxidoreductase [Aurantimonas sp. C2-3-R2]MEC5414480.1 FAD-dependent oxidoreductase [Aurantimonas sp. C2-4-R8]